VFYDEQNLHRWIHVANNFFFMARRFATVYTLVLLRDLPFF